MKTFRESIIDIPRKTYAPGVFDDEDTDNSYGYVPENRPIEEYLHYGLVPLDKPAGPTSHEVVSSVKRLLGANKAGHSGTLDPGVTGLLPIGLGAATKSLSVLLLQPKEYIAIARLHEPVDDEKIKRVFLEFKCEIYQRPPQRSSVKRATRTRTIHNLDILEQKGKLLVIKVLCDAGTYIRIGEVLGPGATMVELRRTKVCHLSEDHGLTRLHDLSYAKNLYDTSTDDKILRELIKPVESVTSLLKRIVIKDSAVDAVCHGAQLAIPGLLYISDNIIPGDKLAFYTLKGELVSIGDAKLSSENISSSEKGIAASPSRVIMREGTYPKLWKKKN